MTNENKITTTLYVAPNGLDAWSGELAEPNAAGTDGPLATLQRARDAVRGLKHRQPGCPISVLIRGGTYNLERSVVFSGRDSGTADSPITYQAYPGETPVFRGCSAITGWQPFRDGIFVASLPQTENQYWRFRELFFNGKRQIRARYPNFDPADPYFGGWAFIEATEPADATAPVSFCCEPGVFPRAWTKPEQGEVFIIPGLAWNSQLLPIRSWDPETRTITVTRRLTQVWDRLMPGNRFYVENLLEELDRPGEWCFDTETQKLYFMPPGGTLAGAEVTVPVTDRLIELRATTGETVRHLRFCGLTFTQTLSAFPFCHPLHPDYLDCNRPNSGGYALFMENTEHCEVEGCLFDQVGGDAIRLHGYSGHNRIVGNEIVGAGAQGICLADLDLWPYDFPAVWRGNEAALRAVSSRLPWAVGNLISQNHIHHCGVIDNFGAAIRLHGFNTDGNVISHNHIHDQPHHGIYLSMGFGRNVIEYNDLHALCRVMADAGGVYSNRWCILEDDPALNQGLVVRHNRIRDVMGVHPHARPADAPGTTPSRDVEYNSPNLFKPTDAPATPGRDRIVRPHMTWGIYFDNSPRRVQIYGNLCEDTTWGGAFLGGGYAEPEDCVVENNIFVNSSTYQFDVVLGSRARGNRFRRNIVCYNSPDAALMRAGRAWKDDTASYAGWAEFDHNMYWQTAGAALRIPDLEGGTLEDWRKLGFDAGTLVADPLFVDAANGDYRLRPDSPALKLGFAQLPLEQMGIRAEAGDLTAARKRAAHRPRRLIYNDDGCGPIMQPGGGTPEGILSGPNSRMTAVPGTQVDSVFICSGATTVVNHPSAVAESYADTEDKYGPFSGGWNVFRDNMRGLEAAGTDLIHLTAKFCREHDREVFYSYRVNDTHDAYDWCAVERSTFKRKNPQYLMSTQDEGDRHPESHPRRIWSALDFDIPEVRTHLLAILEDLAGRYDIDGIELDYFRSPLFFRPNLDFQPATAAQLDILTDFQRQVRLIAERAGQARGRPLLVAARVPMTVPLCNHVGIDIERWLREGLLDVLTTGGGYVPFSMPTAVMVELGHAHGVPVYPTLSASGFRGGEGYDSIAAWRGAAANVWRAGADGIVIFNHFPNQPSPQFQELGDPATLATLDKLFVIDSYYRGTEWGGHSQAIPIDGIIPVEIPADGSEKTVRLPVGDDLPAAAEAGTLASAELRIHLADAAAAGKVEVQLNGVALTPPEQTSEGQLTFRPKGGAFRVGPNDIAFRATGEATAGRLTDVLRVELAVKYRKVSAGGAWQQHEIRQGDGQGGWVTQFALRQVLRHPDCEYTMPFGLAQMDNGEIALVVSREKADPAGGRLFEPNIAFSKDGGATWSPFQAIPGTKGRPQFLSWLGGGRLSFVTEALGGGKVQRFFSNDYGRTWTESVDLPGTRDGHGFGIEGNGWVDRDDKGAPKAILEIGYHLDAGKSHPTGDFTAVFRRSVDGGKTWNDEVSPPQWKFTVEHNGKKWLRGASEGAIVRAANGDLVAALRTDMPPKYFAGPHDDSLEGTAISISKDDGKTWSDLQFLFEAGRHHANLQHLPNGDLVCTLVVRDDIQAGKLHKGELTSHRRGCDALVSHDHGRTWNLDRRYELDGFDFLRQDGYWVDGVCGHVGAVVLDDGHLLAVYGNYPVGAVLIKWRPVRRGADNWSGKPTGDEHTNV